MRWKTNGREFKVCAAEKLLVLLVKMLFDEECFKISLKGRERRAVTEVERQDIYIYRYSISIYNMQT